MDNQNIWKEVMWSNLRMTWNIRHTNVTYVIIIHILNEVGCATTKTKKGLSDLYIICELRSHCPYALDKHEQYRHYHSMTFPVFAQTTNKQELHHIWYHY